MISLHLCQASCLLAMLFSTLRIEVSVFGNLALIVAQSFSLPALRNTYHGKASQCLVGPRCK